MHALIQKPHFATTLCCDRCVIVALAALVLALTGCSGGGEPLVPVSGSVTLGKKPLTTGAVSFYPDASKGNQSRHLPTGSIDSQGRYTLYTTGRKGAPAGAYKVVVFASGLTTDSKKKDAGMPKSLINARYNDDSKTPLKVEVKIGAPPGAYDLQLEQ